MHRKMPVIETKRLILREIQLNDCVDMFEYAQLPDFGPLAGWQSHRSVAETRSIIQLFIDKKKYGQLGTFAVILKEENKMIGTLELHTYFRGFKAELGYSINPRYQGKGYATEAAIEAIIWGFEDLGLARIECATYTHNISSQKVCEKLHFTYEGIRKKGYQLYDGSLHDIKCYGITEDEYFSNYYQKIIYNIKNK